MKKVKKVLLFVCAFVLMFTSAANATPGVEIIDQGKLPAGAIPEPFAETQTTTRYAPWWTVYHMSTPEAMQDNVRAGEGGQIITTIAVSPLDDQIMFIGSDCGGLYRSLDGGKNWFKSDMDLPLVGVDGVAFDPKDKNTIYVLNAALDPGANVTNGKKSIYYGVYKSTDCGKTFKHVLYARSWNWRRNDMVFDKDGALYIASYDGVFKSADKGESWKLLGLANLTTAALYVEPEKKWIVAASDEKGIQFSPDNGKTWEIRNNGIKGYLSAGSVTDNAGKTTSGHNAYVTVNPENHDYWVCVVDGILYETKNSGKNWTELAPPAKDKSFHSTAVLYRAHFGPAKPNGVPKLFLVYSKTANSLRYSDDLGKSWKIPKVDPKYDYVSWDKAEENTGYWQEGIGIHPSDPDVIFFSYNDDIFKSTDGGATFHNSSSGFSGNRAVDIKFDPVDKNKIYIAFTDKGMATYYMDNKNAPDFPVLKINSTMERYAGARSTNGLAIDPNDTNHMITSVGGWSERILAETKDGGKTWKQFQGTNGPNITYIKFHDKDTNIIYAANFKTTDGGKTWNKLANNIKAVSPFNNDIVYAIDASKKIILRSLDQGETWSPLVDTKATCQFITPDLSDPNVLWVGTYNSGIIKITGNTLFKVLGPNEGLVNYDNTYATTFEALSINPKNPKHMIAAGRNSVASGKVPGPYESYDGGETWHVIPGQPGHRDVWVVTFDPHRPRVFMGTSSGVQVYEYEKYKEWKDNYQKTIATK